MLARRVVGGVILLVHVAAASSTLLSAHRRHGQAPASDGQVTAAAELHSLGLEEDIAKAASAEADATSKGLQVGQNGGVADMAREAAEEGFEEAVRTVPDADAMIKEAREFAAEASRHAEHALQMANKITKLPMEAAQKAVAAVEEKISKSAYDAAELAKSTPPESNIEHSRRVAIAVAEAYEPYQLQLLRAQKSMALAYAKAKSAAGGVQGLSAQAHQIATDAQKVQASGDSMKAQHMMIEARATMQKAINLKGWADKFYAQANQINDSLSSYQVAGSQAASQAAAELGSPVTPEPDAERAFSEPTAA